MDAVLLLLKYGADVNAMADERHDYRTVSFLIVSLAIFNFIWRHAITPVVAHAAYLD